MSQMQWTFVSDTGQHFRVGLYHGDESGHLMVQCNGDVLIVDFQVLRSKDYHFMLGDDLFRLRIVREPSRFSYSLTPDETVDNSRNRRIRRDNRRLEYAQIGVLSIAILALTAWFVMRFTNC